MTAHGFLEQLFGRPQQGVASNMRYVTVAQIDLLRTLIDRDEEGGAVRAGLGRSFTWMPSGRRKYVVTEGRDGRRNTLVALAGIPPGAAGTLFADAKQ